jgi:RNA-splicing ligase RtcB
MIELNGKYGHVKVFTDLVEAKALEQIETLLNQEFVEGSKVRIMPDVHAGAGCTIGTTMTITDKVCPNLVGVDIGCGMLTVSLDDEEIDLEKLDRVIREHVPSGFNVRDTKHRYARHTYLEKLICRDHVGVERARCSIGTLGGGNHFIEVDRNDEGELYLVIHSGSRHLGLEVAGYYQHLAEEQLCGRDKNSVKDLIDSLKAQGRHSEIAGELKKLQASTIDITKALAYVSGQLFDDYIHDMKLVQEYAKWNRNAIANVIFEHSNLHPIYDFSTIHNYIDTDAMILRKGAVSAQKGELLLIPINMRDGSLICVGKGNEDWNCSAPHGAGRLMSRVAAKKAFTVDEFAQSMNGIYTTSVSYETLDECPMAYKPIESIVENIGDTVDIMKTIRPIYNFKAGEV